MLPLYMDYSQVICRQRVKVDAVPTLQRCNNAASTQWELSPFRSVKQGSQEEDVDTDDDASIKVSGHHVPGTRYRQGHLHLFTNPHGHMQGRRSRLLLAVVV